MLGPLEAFQMIENIMLFEIWLSFFQGQEFIYPLIGLNIIMDLF